MKVPPPAGVGGAETPDRKQTETKAAVPSCSNPLHHHFISMAEQVLDQRRYPDRQRRQSSWFGCSSFQFPSTNCG